MPATYNLATNVTTNSTSTFQLISEGGRGLLEAEGVWNGASMTFVSKGAQKQNSIPVVDGAGTTVTFTADTQRQVDVGVNESIAVVVTGAGASTNLSASFKRTEQK